MLIPNKQFNQMSKRSFSECSRQNDESNTGSSSQSQEEIDIIKEASFSFESKKKKVETCLSCLREKENKKCPGLKFHEESLNLLLKKMNEERKEKKKKNIDYLKKKDLRELIIICIFYQDLIKAIQGKVTYGFNDNFYLNGALSAAKKIHKICNDYTYQLWGRLYERKELIESTLQNFSIEKYEEFKQECGPLYRTIVPLVDCLLANQ